MIICTCQNLPHNLINSIQLLLPQVNIETINNTTYFKANCNWKLRESLILIIKELIHVNKEWNRIPN